MSELLPQRQYRRKISLTPLVDVIFLLLIFFMLTSQIAPFSIISLSTAKIEKDIEQISIPHEADARSTSFGALINVLNGGVSINGQRVAYEKIDQALAQLRQAGTTAAIISPKSASSVQDLITVLEAVKRASFETIKIRKAKD